ncbi:MAG: tetratricopeptide repeat protein [Bacteroidaceae bacterium]|nr:tetratricopeptide repeat protein [Bacteroidaceae bacterium]
MTEKDYSAYFEQPEFKDTLARYEAMTLRGEHAYFDPEQLTDIAEYYATRNRESEAEKVIDYALAMHPGSTDPMVFRARTYMLRGDLDTAYQVAESIPDQADREVTFLYAELMLNEERINEAQDLLVRRLLANEASHKEYALTVQDIIELFLDYNYLKEATLFAQAALEKAECEEWKPTTRLIVQNLVAECLRNEARFEEASQVLNRMLDEDPYDVSSWLNLGNIYNQMEQFNEAIDALDYALAIEPSNLDALFSKGHSYALLGNEEKALEFYRTCLEGGYDKALASYTCGVMETAIGRYQEAIAHLEYAFKVYGELTVYSFSICFNLALSYIETGEIKRAAEYYHRAFKLDPNDEGLNDLLKKIGK